MEASPQANRKSCCRGGRGGTDTFAACSRAELVKLIALPRSLFALVTSMEKDFGTLLGAAEDTCRPPGSILARQSSVSWESIWAPRTVRSLGISQLCRSTASKVSGCTTRTRCWLPCVLAAFPAGSASRQFRGRSRVRQLSCTPPLRSAWRSRATFGGTAHQKGFLWGFREVGVALIPLTCVTAPGSPRLSSLSV